MSDDVQAGWEGVQDAVQAQTDTAESESVDVDLEPTQPRIEDGKVTVWEDATQPHDLNGDPSFSASPKFISEQRVPEKLGDDPVILEISHGTEDIGTVSVEVVGTETGAIKVAFDPAIYVFKEPIQKTLVRAVSMRVYPSVKVPRASE